MQRTAHRATARGDRGAAIVEFALVFPVFMMLALGIFTGGIAYNRKLSLTNGAREAARYGATLPVPTGAVSSWLDDVAAVAVTSAEGEMDAGATGRSICVAYVDAGSTASRVEAGGSVTYGTDTCYDDDLPADVARVQVVLQRTSDLQALVFKRDLTLKSQAVVRFEAVDS